MPPKHLRAKAKAKAKAKAAPKVGARARGVRRFARPAAAVVAAVRRRPGAKVEGGEPEEEKEAGRLSLERLLRGEKVVIEGLYWEGGWKSP